jgi:hypothetical protein
MTTKTNATKALKATTSTKAPAKAKKAETKVTLKAIFDDICRDNKRTTLTTKKMRVKLRREFAATHDRNEPWVFPARDYDRIRSMFDSAYAAKKAKPARKPRAPKAAQPATPEVTPTA